jgi:hypothetical protein
VLGAAKRSGTGGEAWESGSGSRSPAISSLAALLIGEPITPNLLIGLVAVFAGIWIATSEAKPTSSAAR